MDAAPKTPPALYAVQWVAKTAVAAVLAAFGLAAVAVLLFPWSVARFWWRGQRAYAFGLGAGAWIGVGMGSQDVFAGAFAAGAAMLGAVAGHAFLRQWTFGRCVSALTGGAFGLLLVNNLIYWTELREVITTMSRSYVSQLEQLQAEQGVSLQAEIDANRWLLEHFDYLAFGMLFSSAFFLCIAATALINRGARQEGLALRGGLATMRPPEWAVWVAIGTALLAIAEYHWPNHWAQLIAWNTGLGLVAIYLANGVACVVYLAAAFKLNMLLAVALVAVVLLPPLLQFFALLGFFDTWLELRKKADGIAERASKDGA